MCVLLLVPACSASSTNEPSLAPRAAEAIDPRVPIADHADTSPVDRALAAQLSELVNSVRAGVPAFESREAEAARLAAAAGPVASESWIAAQQALSQLVEQHGVTTKASGDIDALAASRLDSQHWIRPADQQAIAAAAAEVTAIGNSQGAAIDRLTQKLAR